MDIDVPHVGCRGGSVRKRYFGGLEGIDKSLRDALYDEARTNQTSVSEIVEGLVRNYLR